MALQSINFVVLGDPAITAELGKKGTTTDLSIYDRKTAETVYTWTVALTFPDKVQSMLQAVNIAEYAILNVAKLDKFLGEQILALDYANIKGGFILHSYDVDRVKLEGLLKNTVLADYKFLESVEELKQEISKVKPFTNDGPALIPIDHAFDVKGVGTVVLGVVKQGTVKAYDELTILPHNKNVLVKSIQMHDDPADTASSPARVGIAIKGLSANDISRGDIICVQGAAQVSSGPLRARFVKSPFFKGDLSENQMYLLLVGLQIKPVKIRQQDGTVEIMTEKPLVYVPGQTCVLIKPDSTSTRVIGKGTIQ